MFACLFEQWSLAGRCLSCGNLYPMSSKVSNLMARGEPHLLM